MPMHIWIWYSGYCSGIPEYVLFNGMYIQIQWLKLIKDVSYGEIVDNKKIFLKENVCNDPKEQATASQDVINDVATNSNLFVQSIDLR